MEFELKVEVQPYIYELKQDMEEGVPDFDNFPSNDMAFPIQTTLSPYGFVIFWSEEGRPLVPFAPAWFSIALGCDLNLSQLQIYVKDPSDRIIGVAYNIHTSRIDCVFRPLQSGSHTISIITEAIVINEPSTSTSMDNSLEDSTEQHVAEHVSDHNPNYILTKPWGICTIPEYKQIFISDQDANEILVLSFDGSLLRRIGLTETLNKPSGLCYDDVYERVLVADKDNHRIAVFSLDGTYLGDFGSNGSEPGEFQYPWDVDCSEDGSRIIVSDSQNRRVQIFDQDFEFIGEYNGSNAEGSLALDEPRGITFSCDGSSFFVADYNLNKVLKISTDLSSVHVLTQDFENPSGVYIDSVDNLLVCDSKNDCIRVFNKFNHYETSIVRLGSIKLETPINLTNIGSEQICVLEATGRVVTF